MCRRPRRRGEAVVVDEVCASLPWFQSGNAVRDSRGANLNRGDRGLEEFYRVPLLAHVVRHPHGFGDTNTNVRELSRQMIRSSRLSHAAGRKSPWVTPPTLSSQRRQHRSLSLRVPPYSPHHYYSHHLRLLALHDYPPRCALREQDGHWP